MAEVYSVDGWRAIIGGHEYLAKWFFGPDGKPDDTYKAAVKPRFVQWVVDLCTKPFDQAWLDHQHEIGLRHAPKKKDATDSRQTPPLVPLRYLIAFVVPVLSAVQNYLRNGAVSPREAESMQIAWTKAVILSVTLWSAPYAKEGLW